MPRDFVQRFPEEHATFCGAFQGEADFGSVTLHRLMVLYFLQQHGWLAGDRRYLSRPLENGKAAYYRCFLRPLFRDAVPSLGIALFPADLDGDIANAAFHRLFAYFDRYRWSLEDVTADVQPHLLGTLFEKHANRRGTGTYYTPADVTDYITRNTVLPFLLDTGISPCWELLAKSPDRYIPNAVRHGVDEPLPRKQVPPDRIAPPSFALPTESWREYLARRRRSHRLRKRLASGNLASVNYLVTYNLDLHRFVLDTIAQANRKVLRPLLAALERITVLDPTCGSGAFLFTALNLLEELRTACLDRLRCSSDRQTIRSAILRQNLFGIDLREEAVELCRLRLLLHVIAAAKPGNDLDLPDLNANIRAGDVLARPTAERQGFDVVIGNPPYLPVGSESGNGFATAACPDLYARVLERSAKLLNDGGRTGMVVPLSLAFSSDFDCCRQLLFSTYGTNWFSSFARIPSALFAGDIRVRNTIHLGHKSKDSGRQYTTRLHRWFEAARPELFPTLEYTAFRSERWAGRVPRVGQPALTAMWERLLRGQRRLGKDLSSQPTPHALHFKKTAYNWLTFCRQLPPCFAADGSPIAHTQFDVLYFADTVTRDLAFLLLNGKWAFAWWCAVGDDFHVTRWMIADLPVDLKSLPRPAVRRLVALVPLLEETMTKAVSFKRNAGKRVGTYNLARCRHITDRSDRIFAECFNSAAAWEDVELLVRQVVKTEFDG